MNVWLQIGLGLLPGSLAVAFLLLRRRAWGVVHIFFTFLLLAGAGGALLFGVRGVMANGGLQGTLAPKKMMAMATALAGEGAYDDAREVVDEYSRAYGYDDACRLLTARMELMRGDYDSAQGIYRYLCANSKLVDETSEEVALAAANSGTAQSDKVMLRYLQSIGANPEEYGYSAEAVAAAAGGTQQEPEDTGKRVARILRNSDGVSEEISNCAGVVAQVTASYEGTTNDEEGVGKYRRAFASLEEASPELLTLGCVKKARIKAEVLAGDYEKITKNINGSSSYHELMIAAELYMSGLVKKADFAESYQVLSRGEAAAVKAQVQKVYSVNQSAMSKVEAKNLKARVVAVANELDDPTLAAIKEQLASAAEREAGTDKTKVCLELAKIEHYYNNTTASDGYLSDAIYSSQDCEDDSYVAAMGQIIGVISNNDEEASENIKNVSDYVDTVLDHSLTVNVEKIVSPQNQATQNRPAQNNSLAPDGAAGAEAAAPPAPVDFSQAAVDFVSKAKSAISIGRIDAGNFPEITARVQISSDYITNIDEMKNALQIYDCSARIEDFTLNKINYTGSNITLVCDVSGSMQGSIQDLRDAVTTFIADKGAGEKLSVVTFDDSIVATKPFGTSDEELTSFAKNMQAEGGTDMFSAVINCLGSFPADTTANNVLILMTDGCDNNPRSSEEIKAQIGELATKKGVTVYAMGLGSGVDTAYLEKISGSGNGKLVYISDSASLSSFYNMLHERVNNQYEITYRAQDTITRRDRTLEVTLPSENTRDQRLYSLGDAQEGTEGSGLTASQNLTVEGFSPRYIYKGLQDIDVLLKGTGFRQESTVTVKLKGNIDYTLNATFVDSETYKMTVPASIALGSYTVEITIDAGKKVIANGFSVIEQGSEKSTAFGPYVFTSAEKIQNADGSLTLRGAVAMNGWLRFNGDVTLAGNLETDTSIRMTDNAGSYVQFDPGDAKGLAKYMADKGAVVNLPRLNTFTLYNDQQHLYDYENYEVDDIRTPLLTLHQAMRLYSPTLRLYPDSFGIYYSAGSTIFPYQDEILDLPDDMFSFDFDGSAVITNNRFGLVAEFEYEDPEDTFRPVNLFNAPVNFNGGLNFKLDTIQQEYEIGAKVRFAFLADKSAFSLGIGWAGDMIPDSVTAGMEFGKPVKLPTAFPLELTAFSGGVEGIAGAVRAGDFTQITLTGSVSLSSLSAKEYLPKIGDFLGDKALLEMPETTFSFCLNPASVEANAELNLFGEIKLAEAEVKLGNFAYSNHLLGMNEEDVAGLYLRLKEGLMWNANDNIDLQLSGQGELSAHTRFIGVDVKGTASYNIKWWCINSSRALTGETVFGLYTTHDGKFELVFAFEEQDTGGKRSGKFYYIDENGKSGPNNGTITA